MVCYCDVIDMKFYRSIDMIFDSTRFDSIRQNVLVGYKHSAEHRHIQGIYLKDVILALSWAAQK